MRLPALLAACLLLAGCQGLLEDGAARPGGALRPPRPADPMTCVEDAIPAPQPLRRLSSEQYERVVGELVPGELGRELLARSTFPETRIERGFASDAQANTVSTVESNAIEDSAAAMAAHVLAESDTAIPALVGSCVGAGFTDAQLAACVPEFIQRFGARAFRRPLTAGETGIMTRLYTSIATAQGAREGVAAVVQLVLQSPALLYRTERGLAPDASGAVALTSDEVATRLAFFLRGSLPDDELLAAAREDRLRTTDDIAAQASRLAREDSFVTVLAEFHRDWLRAYLIGRDPRRHALFTPAVQRALELEMTTFVRAIFVEGDGRFETLMTVTRFPVAAELGPVYGVEGADGASVEVPHRRGVLTLASVLAGLADEDVSHPIQRGAFLRQAVLCGAPLTLPPGIDVAAETAATSHLPTARERLAPLTERGDCRGCHSQINPLGLGLENYDQLGAWRDTENDRVIDASGALAVESLSGSFATPEELIDVIARSDAARDCYATQMYRFAMGRPESEEDRCTLARVRQRFAASGGDVRELAIAIAASRPFSTRGATEE